MTDKDDPMERLRKIAEGIPDPPADLAAYRAEHPRPADPTSEKQAPDRRSLEDLLQELSHPTSKVVPFRKKRKSRGSPRE